MEQAIAVSYQISDEEIRERFHFKLDADSFALLNRGPKDVPAWAELEHNQCQHCPLDPATDKYCPIALQLADIVQRFDKHRSIDEVRMDVLTAERRVVQKVDLQRAVASMLELVFPASGCPKTEFMRPLARFHLPLASEEETVFRITSTYLLGQYFLSTVSQAARIEFQGLIENYEELSVLHKAVARRLQQATRSDAVKNAIALLDMYSTLVPLLIEDELAEMRGFFNAYLPEGEEGTVASERKSAPGDAARLLERIKNLELMPLDLEDDESPEPAQGEVQEPDNSKLDEILQGSTLSLAPVVEEEEPESKADEPEPESKGSAPNKPSGRAVFTLPDD